MRVRKLNTGAVKLTRYRSVGEFHDAQVLHNGYLAVDYNGYPIDSYIRRGNSGVMVVVFHAALLGQFTYPVFQGGGILRGLDVTRVAISDPTIGQTQLGLSWYAGSQAQPDLQWVVRGIIDKIAQLTDTQHIVFFGGSGGGFAALQIARHFPASLALPMNPQTSIARYTQAAVDRYLDQAWETSDIGKVPVDHDLTVSYANGHENTIGYIQNLRDTRHIENHEQPFFNGLPTLERVHSFTGVWGDSPKIGHVPPPKNVIRNIFKAVSTADGDWQTALDSAGFVPGATRLDQASAPESRSMLRGRRPGTDSNPVTEFGKLDTFLQQEHIPSGRFSIGYGGLPVDFTYTDNGATTTVICFHGAIQTTVALPWHVGETVVNEGGANWLAVSGPSLIYGGGLKLAWYAGSCTQPELQQLITDVIAHVQKVTGVEHLVFFGTSGGGFAALEYSRRFPGSLALPVNPQTAITRHRPSTVNLYTDTVWPGNSPLASQSENHIRYDQTVEYVESFPNTVAYLQNSRDEYHITQHLLPFLRTVGGHPSLRLLMGAWGDPARSTHVPPEKPQLVRILTELVAAEGDWLPALQRVGFSDDTDPSLIPDCDAALNEALSNMSSTSRNS